VHPNVIDDADAITALLERTKRIAVLGIKTENQSDAPAFYVPKLVQEMGFEIVPVPVYFPDVTEILGRPVYRAGTDSPPPPVDMVDVFRRPRDLMPHLGDLLAARPKSVWLQQGIRDDVFADLLAEAGITVVQDRCLMVELRLREALKRKR
jgi:hypothetical protein